MTNSPFFNQQLQQILDSQEFERLDAFKDRAIWSSLNSEDCEFLAFLFLKQGEMRLKNKNSSFYESFAIATEILPRHEQILYRMALIYGDQEQESYLHLATKCLDAATKLQANFFDGWYAWANILVRKGAFYGEMDELNEADSKFQQALTVGTEHPTLTITPDFFWHWGLCWHYIGKQSGEAMDFKMGLQKFNKALELGFTDKIFYNDYGNALLEMGSLLNRNDLINEATIWYQKASVIDGEYFESWYNLACCQQYLWETTSQNDHFFSAVRHFEHAIKIREDHSQLLFKFGTLLSQMGKRLKDLELLQSSIHKFEKADSLDPGNPYILCRWAESQMLHGSQLERVDYLRGAEEKILRSLELLPESVESWYIYGTCLTELGCYFGDGEYYKKAIEKFQYGLSLQQNESLLLHGLALAYFAIGEMNDDPTLIERTCYYCSCIIENGGNELSQFWNDWGIALMKLGEMKGEKQYLEAAVEKFEQAIASSSGNLESKSTDTEWLYNYGCALDFLGDFYEDPQYYEKAIKILSHVLLIDPQYSHARYNLALAFSHQGELTSDIESFYQAIELFQNIVSQDSEDEMAWNEWGLTLLNLAQLINEPSHPDLAQALHEQAEMKLMHAASLGCVHAYYNLACLYSLSHHYSAAMDFIEKAEAAEALPSLDDMLTDEWLDGLRSTQAFRSFIAEISIRQIQKDEV